MTNLAIFGATSAIAQETARLAALKGYGLFLVGRNPEKLRSVVQDLETRFDTKVGSLVADLNEFLDHEDILKKADEELDGMDAILIAHGTLGDQVKSQEDWKETNLQITTNFLGPISLLTRAASLFETKKAGTIAVITSVAGDRGRKSNYVYGTTKGALSLFLQGLRNRLFASGIHVLDIRPGFVTTPMTAHMKQTAMFVTPDRIGKGIIRAMEKKKDVVYLPARWRLIMAIIRAIPERIFKRLSL